VTNDSKTCIAVSTVVEAEMFADGGYDDIVYSHLFTADKMPR
jgi:D-serine deaminase-like pyridoxal phosphate-dependent protein